MIKEFLQGTWANHPLHPVLVHIPSALWPAALLFDILSRLAVNGNVMVQISFYAIGFGLLVSLLAVPTGLADWWDIKQENPAWTLGLYHLIINVAAMVIWAVNFVLRWSSLEATAVATMPLLLSIVGTLLLFVSGYLGGWMVYAYGIGVARTSKNKWRKAAEEGKARVS